VFDGGRVGGPLILPRSPDWGHPPRGGWGGAEKMGGVAPLCPPSPPPPRPPPPNQETLGLVKYFKKNKIGGGWGGGGGGGGYKASVYTGLLTVVVGLRLEQN